MKRFITLWVTIILCVISITSVVAETPDFQQEIMELISEWIDTYGEDCWELTEKMLSLPVAPKDGDISTVETIAIAISALMEALDVDIEYFEPYRAFLGLNQEGKWIVSFLPAEPRVGLNIPLHYVTVDATNGTVLGIRAADIQAP